MEPWLDRQANDPRSLSFASSTTTTIATIEKSTAVPVPIPKPHSRPPHFPCRTRASRQSTGPTSSVGPPVLSEARVQRHRVGVLGGAEECRRRQRRRMLVRSEARKRGRGPRGKHWICWTTRSCPRWVAQVALFVDGVLRGRQKRELPRDLKKKKTKKDKRFMEGAIKKAI